MKGFALLPVLVLLLVISLVVLAEAGRSVAARREREWREEERRVEEALAYGVALTESRLRRRLADPTPLTAEELVDPFLEATYPLHPEGEGDALSLRSRIIFGPGEESADTIARSEQDGRPVAVVRPLLHLPEVEHETLAGFLVPHFEEESLAEEAAGWTAGLLRRLRVGGRPPFDTSALANALESAYLENLPADPRLRRVLERWREIIPKLIDPDPRLRRTNAHPHRLRGRDRGAYPGSGGVVSPRLSGRFTVEVEVRKSEEATIRRTRARLQLLERVSLRFQDDWLTPTLRQPGGIEWGEALPGPEVVSDADWVEEETTFAAAPEGLDPASCGWRLLPRGALLIGRGHGAQLHVDETAAIELVPFPLRDDVLPTSPVPVIAGREWVVPGRGGRAFIADEVDLLDHQQWRELSLPFEVSSLYPLTTSVLAVGLRGEVASIVPPGDVRRDLAIRRRPVLLPLQDRLLVPGERAGLWLLIDADLSVVEIPGPELKPTAPDPVSDGGAGVWLVDRRVDGDRLGHATLFTEGLSVRWSLTPTATIVALAAFPLRGFAVTVSEGGSYVIWRSTAVGPVEAGSGALPAFEGRLVADPAGPRIWIPVTDGVFSISLTARREKHLELGGHVLLAPRSHDAASLFSAPLREGLTALFGGVEEFPAAGTVNRGGSVLRARDLSDLTVDGVYLSPLRRETLRYSTLEAGVNGASLPPSAGRGQLLIKPERSSEESPEPNRERVLLRLRHHYAISFEPTLDWVVEHHPQHPERGSIHSIVRDGPRERFGEATSTVRRHPARSRWRHHRRLRLVGDPWVVRVRVGDPPVELPPWTIDQVDRSRVLESESFAADVGEGGEWQRLQWGWRGGGEAWLRVGGEAGTWGEVLAESAVGGEVFRMEPLDWTLELGGELGGKAFRGTIRDVALEPPPPSFPEFPSIHRYTRSLITSIPISAGWFLASSPRVPVSVDSPPPARSHRELR